MICLFVRERMSQELRRSTLSPTTVESKSFTRTSLTTHSSSRRSTSPHRSSSPTRRSLSPSRSGQRSPERSILKSSSAYRSSSPERSTEASDFDSVKNGVIMENGTDKEEGYMMVPQLSLSRLVSQELRTKLRE